MAADEHDPDRTGRIPSSDDDATRPIGSDDDLTRPIERDDDLTRPIDRASDETRALPGVHDESPATTRRIERVDELAGPHTERIYTRDPRPPMTGWVIAAIIVVALLIGSVLGYSNADPSDNNVLARALVSTEGGTITFDDRGKVEIPAEALTTGTVITVRKETIAQRVRLGPEGDPGTVVYEPGDLDVYVFEPEGLRFQREVTITVPRTPNGEALLVDADQPKVIPGEVRGDVIVVETMSFGFET